MNSNNILIFKTNIQTEYDKSSIQRVFLMNNKVKQLNIDLHDIDRVLRVVTDCLTHEEVISEIRKHGFECAELK